MLFLDFWQGSENFLTRKGRASPIMHNQTFFLMQIKHVIITGKIVMIVTGKKEKRLCTIEFPFSSFKPLAFVLIQPRQWFCCFHATKKGHNYIITPQWMLVQSHTPLRSAWVGRNLSTSEKRRRLTLPQCRMNSRPT